MLYQTDIYTAKTDTENLYSNLSVKIHGFIMSRIDKDFAAELHSGKVNPFAVYTVDAGDYYITRVSALNDRAIQITEIFRNLNEIRVFGTKNNLTVMKAEEPCSVSVRSLPELLPHNRYTLTFLTPAMFRRNGDWMCPPELPSYFLSVAAKLDEFENIKINRDDIFSEFQRVKIGSYSLSSAMFLNGSRKYTGMIGKVAVTLPQRCSDNDILRLLLAYGTFSGVGGMTPQGMGGFLIERT